MKKILIADDAMFMRISLKSVLERNGFEVIAEAENGKQAIEKYKLLKPDIVTLDITMPIMTGLEALKEIKNFDRNAKIIMISSMGQESIVRDAVVAGAFGFIVKPFKEETIIKVFSKL
ncbi:response regulator [Clostridium cellulovorans]|uniref:Stage 0 sporulation protein A homolog n=1 Tax=Clostridium cellulovorans (strain ATCC 35296 / DSM 3052 / OCM 3 / 743B) TaxID=573061 RepID=D9SLR0_CLOC7|nr:response regulator [Clostridium cellulovorans]ADL53697.1 response regulator receiver protein [Clostridium cellulovorans 743B]